MWLRCILNILERRHIDFVDTYREECGIGDGCPMPVDYASEVMGALKVFLPVSSTSLANARGVITVSSHYVQVPGGMYMRAPACPPNAKQLKEPSCMKARAPGPIGL